MSPSSGRAPLPTELRSDRLFLLVGAALTVVLALAVAAYAALTWHEPHRHVLAGLAAAAAADGILLASLPHQIVLTTRWREALLVSWALAHIAAVTAVALADGGMSSPLVAILYVILAYAALWYAPGSVLVVGAGAVAGFAAIGLLGAGGAIGKVAFDGLAALSVAVLAALIARSRAATRATLHHSRAETIRRLSRALECRDPDTGLHVERIGDLCAEIAGELGMPAAEAELMRLASPMHDVGKIAVPDQILHKPGPLTDEERAVMQGHAEHGHRMLAGSGTRLLDLAATIALTHHERWDGGGYPAGLAAGAIPLPGRIVAVADVYDALTSDRPYRRAFPRAEALAMIAEERGRHFDPVVVDALLAVLRRRGEGGGAGPVEGAVAGVSLPAPGKRPAAPLPGR